MMLFYFFYLNLSYEKKHLFANNYTNTTKRLLISLT
jgi:hypothetical protein